MSSKKESSLKAFKETFLVYFRSQLRLFEEFKQKVEHNQIDVIEHTALRLGRNLLQQNEKRRPTFVGPFAVTSPPVYLSEVLDEKSDAVALFGEQDIYQLMVGMGYIEAVLEEIAFEVVRIFEYQILILSQSHRLSLLCEFMVDKIFFQAKQRFLITLPEVVSQFAALDIGDDQKELSCEDIIEFTRNDILSALFDTETISEEEESLHALIHSSEVVTIHTGQVWKLSEIFTHTGLMLKKKGSYEYFASFDYQEGYKKYGFRSKMYVYDVSSHSYVDHPNDLCYDQSKNLITTLEATDCYKQHFSYIPYYLTITQEEFNDWLQLYEQHGLSTQNKSQHSLISLYETITNLYQNQSNDFSKRNNAVQASSAHILLFQEIILPSNMQFHKLDFAGCYFFHSYWNSHEFTRCKFDHSDIRYAIIKECTFDNCSLRNTNLSWCYVNNMILKDYKITSFLHLQLNYSWISESELIDLIKDTLPNVNKSISSYPLNLPQEEKDFMLVNKIGTIFLQENAVNHYYHIPYYFSSKNEEEETINCTEVRKTEMNPPELILPENTLPKRKISRLPSLYATPTTASRILDSVVSNMSTKGSTNDNLGSRASISMNHPPLSTIVANDSNEEGAISVQNTLILRGHIYDEFIQFVKMHESLSTTKHIVQIIMGEEGIGETSMVLSYLQHHVIANYPSTKFWIQWFDASNLHQLYIALLSWTSHLQLIVPNNTSNYLQSQPQLNHMDTSQTNTHHNPHTKTIATPEDIEALLYYIQLQLITLGYEKVILIFYHAKEIQYILQSYIVPLCMKYTLTSESNRNSLQFQMILLPPNNQVLYTTQDVEEQLGISSSLSSPIAIQILHMTPYSNEELHSFLEPKLQALPSNKVKRTLLELRNNSFYVSAEASSRLNAPSEIEYSFSPSWVTLNSTSASNTPVSTMKSNQDVNSDGRSSRGPGYWNDRSMNVMKMEEDLIDRMQEQKSIQQLGRVLNNHPLALRLAIAYIKQQQLISKYEEETIMGSSSYSMDDGSFIPMSYSAASEDGKTDIERNDYHYGIKNYIDDFLQYQMSLSNEDNCILQQFSGNMNDEQMNTRDIIGITLLMKTFQLKESQTLLATVSMNNRTVQNQNEQSSIGSSLWKVLFFCSHMAHNLIPITLLQNMVTNERELLDLLTVLQDYELLQLYSLPADERINTVDASTIQSGKKHLIPYINSTTLSHMPTSCGEDAIRGDKVLLFIHVHPMIQDFYRIYFLASSQEIRNAEQQEAYVMELMELLSLQLQYLISLYRSTATASTNATALSNQQNESHANRANEYHTFVIHSLLSLLPHAIFVIDHYLPLSLKNSLTASSRSNTCIIYINSLWKLLEQCIEAYILLEQFVAAKQYFAMLLQLIKQCYPNCEDLPMSLETVYTYIIQAKYYQEHQYYQVALKLLLSLPIQMCPLLEEEDDEEEEKEYKVSSSVNMVQLCLQLPYLSCLSDCYLRLSHPTEAEEVYHSLHLLLQQQILPSLTAYVVSCLPSHSPSGILCGKVNQNIVIVMTYREYQVFSWIAKIVQSIASYYSMRVDHVEEKEAMENSDDTTEHSTNARICQQYFEMALQLRHLLSFAHINTSVYNDFSNAQDTNQNNSAVSNESQAFTIPPPPTSTMSPRGKKTSIPPQSSDNQQPQVTMQKKVMNMIDHELLSLYLEIGEFYCSTSSYLGTQSNQNGKRESRIVDNMRRSSLAFNSQVNPFVAKRYMEKVLMINKLNYEEYSAYYQNSLTTSKRFQLRTSNEISSAKKTVLSNLFSSQPDKEGSVVETRQDTTVVHKVSYPAANHMAYLCDRCHEYSERYSDVLYALGVLYYSQCLYAEAITYLEECYAILQQIQSDSLLHHHNISLDHYQHYFTSLQYKIYTTGIYLAYLYQRFAVVTTPTTNNLRTSITSITSSTLMMIPDIDHQEEKIRQYLLPAISILQSVKFPYDVTLAKCSVLLDIAFSYQVSQLHQHVIIFIEDLIDICRGLLVDYGPSSAQSMQSPAILSKLLGKKDAAFTPTSKLFKQYYQIKIRRILLTSYLIASISYYHLHRYHYAYLLHSYALQVYDEMQTMMKTLPTASPQTASKTTPTKRRKAPNGANAVSGTTAPVDNKSALYSQLADFYRNEDNDVYTQHYMNQYLLTPTMHGILPSMMGTQKAKHPLKTQILFLQTHFPFSPTQLALLLYETRYISPITKYFLIEENVYMFQEESAYGALQKFSAITANHETASVLEFPLSVCIDVLKECCDFTWNYNQESFVALRTTTNGAVATTGGSHRNANSQVKKGHSIARQATVMNSFTHKVVLETTLMKCQQQQQQQQRRTTPTTTLPTNLDPKITIQAIYETLVKCGFQLGTLDTHSDASTTNNHEWISLKKVIFLLQLESKFRDIMIHGKDTTVYQWSDSTTIPKSLVLDLFTATTSSKVTTATNNTSNGMTIITPQHTGNIMMETTNREFYNRKEVLLRFRTELRKHNPKLFIPAL